MAKYLIHSRRHVWQRNYWRMIMSLQRICLEKAIAIQPGIACHWLLVVILLTDEVAEPHLLWDQFKAGLCDNVKHKLHYMNYYQANQEIPEDNVYNYGLWDLNRILVGMGRSLAIMYVWSRDKVAQGRTELLQRKRELTTRIREQPWSQLIYCVSTCCYVWLYISGGLNCCQEFRREIVYRLIGVRIEHVRDVNL